MLVCGSAVAVVLGAGLAAKPQLTLGATAVATVGALAFLAPATHLALLLIATAIVPYDLQNAYGFGSGSGLILSDVLLLSGLLRAAVAIPRTSLSPGQLTAALILAAVLAISGVQLLRGYQAGAGLSLAGYEFRALLGWSTLFIALPIVAEPAGRARLLRALLVVGLLLGLWGLVQYFVNIPVIGGGSAGVRQDVAYTEGARSIQGGLFGFPIAFVLGLAALSIEGPRRPIVRTALVGLVLLNGAALVLTYQRTFWVAAAVGFVFLIARAGRGRRLKPLLMLVGAAMVVVPVMAVAAPGALSSAQQRLLSLGQYASDNSVRARIAETRAVVSRIHDAPLAGWGLGDEVVFGYPWLRVPPFATPYTHNGYLWIAWKLGIPAAVLLVALLLRALAARGGPALASRDERIRQGAQAGLLATLTVCLAFPAFRALAITTTLGVLVTLALMAPSSAGKGGTQSLSRPPADPARRR